MIKIKNKALKGYKFIDLFCGIGGFNLALSSFGAKCVFSIDNDKNVCETYIKNFGIDPYGNIKDLNINSIPSHDILCAGFPCQPFSISGSKKGFKDTLGRGRLFFEIVKIIKIKEPKIVFLENVKNLMNHNSGKTFKVIKKAIEDIGYSVFSSVLNASDYGVPQARKRIYILAFRNDLKIDKFVFPTPLRKLKILSDYTISDKKNDVPGTYYINRKYSISKKYSTNIRSKKILRIGKIGLGRQGERIYSFRGQSITLSSQGGGLAGKTGMYYFNKKIRKLYPRECARIMGFPDWFVLPKTQEQCYKQFGNSVVIDVLQCIIKEIVKILR